MMKLFTTLPPTDEVNSKGMRSATFDQLKRGAVLGSTLFDKARVKSGKTVHECHGIISTYFWEDHFANLFVWRNCVKNCFFNDVSTMGSQ